MVGTKVIKELVESDGKKAEWQVSWKGTVTLVSKNGSLFASSAYRDLQGREADLAPFPSFSLVLDIAS